MLRNLWIDEFAAPILPTAVSAWACMGMAEVFERPACLQ